MNDDLNSNKMFTEVSEQYYMRGSIISSVYIESFIQLLIHKHFWCSKISHDVLIICLSVKNSPENIFK